MLREQMIPANEFCSHHHIEISFLQSLHEYGIIEIVTEEKDCFLSPGEIDRIEKMVRLHYDLHINLEGIDAIQHLLQRMETMEEEMNLLKLRLRSYEE